MSSRRCSCGKPATMYAMDPMPDGWGDYYCGMCKPDGFTITDFLTTSDKEGE